MHLSMWKLVTKIGLILAVALLAACNLPRGAPMRSEIVGNDNAKTEDLGISVEVVTQSSVNRFNSWPATGWHGHYHWFSSTRGPDSIIITPGDRLNLTIWESSDNSLLTGIEDRNVNVSKMEVSATGTVFVPYANEVQVAGLDATQARELIQKKIGDVAPDAQVQLEIQAGTNNSVFLVSGVSKPGSYNLPNRNFSLLALLSLGGGIAPSIENPLIRIVRAGQNYEIPAKELFTDASKNVTLRGGDKVIVDEDERFFTGIGAAKNEKLVYFDRENISVLEALTMMGGLLDTRANPQGVLVLRQYPQAAVKSNGKGPSNASVVFSIDLASAEGLFGARNFKIHPGDTVLATESALTTAGAVLALVGTAFAIANVVN